MPGIARNSACTTRRMEGTTEISRSARRMRSARRTVTPSPAGTKVIATITKSKTFQAERKKASR